jgi:hypothetical protein
MIFLFFLISRGFLLKIRILSTQAFTGDLERISSTFADKNLRFFKRNKEAGLLRSNLKHE